MRSLIVSLHDVAPPHLDRLRRAEALFRKLGVARVQYLFVPDFHGKFPATRFPEFLAWCREPRPFEVSWWLHGYYHLDRASRSNAPLSGRERFLRRFLTAGEGEFLPLDAAEQDRRLKAGLAMFAECLPGIRPQGFVAPAWLYRPGTLYPLLRARGIGRTEDHHALHHVREEDVRSLRAPVVTWATRNAPYRWLSLAVCPLRAWWFRDADVLRVATHPHDFAHAATSANIEAVLARALRDRRCVLPEALSPDGR